METAIQIIAWVGVAGALALTIVALKLLALVLNALGHIRTLAEITADSAHALSGHVAASERLSAVDEPAAAIGRSGGRVGTVGTTLADRLEAVAAGLARGSR